MLVEVFSTPLKKLETHRFRIDDSSSRVLERFRAELEKFKSIHSEIIGATIFGSHTKGTARTEDHIDGKSDIDSFIFVDEAKTNLPEKIEMVGVSGVDANNKYLIEVLTMPFREIIAQTENVEIRILKDIRLRLLSKARIDQELIQMEDDYSWTASDLMRIFQLQIGHDLNPYRAYVLSELKKRGDKGEEIWKERALDAVLYSENANLMKGFTDEKIEFQEKREQLYPQTIDDAVKYFHLENVQPKYS